MLTRLLPVVLLPAVLFGQTTAQRKPFIRATGEGVVNVTPDQSKVNFAVVTEAATAADAAAANATQTTSLIAALRAILGSDVDIHTSSYSLSPKYVYPRDGNGSPTLTGFIAQNSVEATINDLSLIGKTIDAGVKGGANRVDSLRLLLKDESAARAQALRAAGQKARADAEAIGAGLGVKVGAVIAADESYSVRPVPLDRGVAVGAAMAAPTPIETGTLEVRASVTVEFELL